MGKNGYIAITSYKAHVHYYHDNWYLKMNLDQISHLQIKIIIHKNIHYFMPIHL